MSWSANAHWKYRRLRNPLRKMKCPSSNAPDSRKICNASASVIRAMKRQSQGRRKPEMKMDMRKRRSEIFEQGHSTAKRLWRNARDFTMNGIGGEFQRPSGAHDCFGRWSGGVAPG